MKRGIIYQPLVSSACLDPVYTSIEASPLLILYRDVLSSVSAQPRGGSGPEGGEDARLSFQQCTVLQFFRGGIK